MQIYPNAKQIKNDEDHRGNSLYNVKIHPLSTSDRIAFGNSLTPSDKNVVVFDSDTNRFYTWDGTDWITPTASSSRFVFHQNMPSAVWTIHHSLGCKPSVTVINSAGDWVLVAPQYVDDNNIILTFGGAFSGEAYIN